MPIRSVLPLWTPLCSGCCQGLPNASRRSFLDNGLSYPTSFQKKFGDAWWYDQPDRTWRWVTEVCVASDFGRKLCRSKLARR